MVNGRKGFASRTLRTCSAVIVCLLASLKGYQASPNRILSSDLLPAIGTQHERFQKANEHQPGQRPARSLSARHTDLVHHFMLGVSEAVPPGGRVHEPLDHSSCRRVFLPYRTGHLSPPANRIAMIVL